MARLTVEDCIDKIPSRFELVLLAAHRARSNAKGSDIAVDPENDKNAVIATTCHGSVEASATWPKVTNVHMRTAQLEQLGHAPSNVRRFNLEPDFNSAQQQPRNRPLPTA